MTATHTFSTSAMRSSLRVAARAPVGQAIAASAAAPAGEVLLTIRDVAAACKLSETAVRRAIADGELPAAKLRSRMRITREDFNAWIASQRQAPARPIAPLRAAARTGRPAPAGSFRALVQADATRATGNAARAHAR
jgi:excisionase family DNA binding protein